MTIKLTDNQLCFDVCLAGVNLVIYHVASAFRHRLVSWPDLRRCRQQNIRHRQPLCTGCRLYLHRGAILFDYRVGTFIGRRRRHRLTSAVLCVHRQTVRSSLLSALRDKTLSLNTFGRRLPDSDEHQREDIFGDCDEQLFSRINTNSLHILHQYLPDRPTSGYSLRPRPHNKTLITKTSELNDGDFIIRNIYKDLYWFSHVLELYAYRHTLLILCMSFMFCTVSSCDCQLIIKENYDDDDDQRSTHTCTWKCSHCSPHYKCLHVDTG